MKKPAGVTKEQWAKYKELFVNSDYIVKKGVEMIADTNFQAGKLTERHRIIKLLEPFAKHYEFCYEKKQLICYFDDCHAYDYQHAIELIKGEQK